MNSQCYLLQISCTEDNYILLLCQLWIDGNTML